MDGTVTIVIISLVVLTINCTALFLSLPHRYNLPVTIGTIVLFSIALYASMFVSGSINNYYAGLRGLLYLPLLMWLLEGMFFQKVFAVIIQLLLTVLQFTIVETLVGLFVAAGSGEYYVYLLAVSLAVYAVYIVLVFHFGRRIYEKMFAYGRSKEWLLYSFGAAFSYAILSTSRLAPNSVLHSVLILFFILWSFIILCFTIINTHEKSKQRYEAEFARDIISSGRDHYQKMSEMYDILRILRHDYKYHLDAIRELLNSGNEREAEKYLCEVQKQLAENELPSYCANPVLNALLASYSERCMQLNIRYNIEVSIPKNIVIPNYEMCIVLGNLLENAVEACSRQDVDRRIELIINTQGTHLAIMVKNNFDGEIMQKDGLPISVKQDGGLGLRSVQAVAARYGGELMTECEGSMFMAYVLMRV